MSFSIPSPFRRHDRSVRAAFARIGANASLLMLVAIAACAGADKSPTEPAVTPPVTPPVTPDPGVPATGIVSVVPTGLPVGVSGRVTVKSGNTQHVLIGASSVAGLAPGDWIVAADNVTDGGVSYLVTPATQTVAVAASATTIATVSYAPNSGALDLTVSGLPAGGAGDITVTGPGNFQRNLGTTTSLRALTPGTYHFAARGVKLASGSFAPTVADQDVNVAAGNTPVTAAVAYVSAPSVVSVIVGGLAGSNAAVSLTPPSGAPIVITGSTRLAAALAGRWQMSAALVHNGGFTWAPTPASKDTVVAAGDSLAFNVQYALTTGALAVVVGGLPSGAPGAVNVTGPNGFIRTLTATTTVTDLVPGVYTVSADSLLVNGLMYRSAGTTQQVTVTASLTAAPATVSYSSAIATLIIGLTGLPVGATNVVEVTGPAGFSRFISGTTTFANVAPGVYTVTANAIILPGGVRYDGTPASVQRTLSFGSTDSVGIAFARAGGRLALTVTGLPAGASATISLTGNSTTLALTGTTTVDPVIPGSYTLIAAPVTIAGTAYTPTPVSSALTFTTGTTTSATVAYAAVAATPPGRVAVTVNGLPVAATAAISLIGSSGSQAVTGSTTIDNVVPGNYTLTASAVTFAGTTYTPTPTSMPLVIVSGSTMNASVTYAVAPGGGSGLNLTVDGFYLTQATQKMDNSVPLVANRDALLRVFVHANQTNTAQPPVRVRVYDGATLLQTLTLSAPETSVRTALAEGTLGSTWNSVIPAANVRTAMRVVVDVDPADVIAESDETDNSWPRSGTPQSITVNIVPTFNLRFVPVTVGALTGNVTIANKDQFLVSARRMHPINDVVSDVRAPFTSSATALQSGDGNGAWTTVLSEVNALRAADGAPSTLHYYGVVKVAYNSGVAGYGFVPGRTAIGWDYLPSGDDVAVHEIGHNFGRPHTNCGGPANPDLSYPYAAGTIGTYGWNSGTGLIIPMTYTDVMGYCSNQWTSDWTWTKVMTYRASSGFSTAAAVVGTKQDGLLVWGRVVNGKVVLEPAFRVTARPTPAQAGGTHRLQALDARGNTLLDFAFSPERVDHAFDRDERQFAIVVPYSATLARSLATLRVFDVQQPMAAASVNSRSTTAAAFSVSAMDSVPVAMPATAATISNIGTTRKRIEWNKAAYPMAMARDAATGEIMAFLRNSGDGMVSGGRSVDLVLSDGVRSMVITGGN
jgi:hypothetical protein